MKRHNESFPENPKDWHTGLNEQKRKWTGDVLVDRDLAPVSVLKEAWHSLDRVHNASKTIALKGHYYLENAEFFQEKKKLEAPKKKKKFKSSTNIKISNVQQGQESPKTRKDQAKS
ncbi:MAG: hypothetical protein ACTSYS_05710 [Promethearchaeota archaeon]